MRPYEVYKNTGNQNQAQQRLLSTKDPVQQKKVNAEFKKAQRKFGQNMVQTITSVMVRTTLVPVELSRRAGEHHSVRRHSQIHELSIVWRSSTQRSARATPSRDLTLGVKEQKRNPKRPSVPAASKVQPGKTELRGTLRWRFCHRWVRAINP